MSFFYFISFLFTTLFIEKKGHNVVFIAEAVDKPIGLVKEWMLVFEKEN